VSGVRRVFYFCQCAVEDNLKGLSSVILEQLNPLHLLLLSFLFFFSVMIYYWRTPDRFRCGGRCHGGGPAPATSVTW